MNIECIIERHGRAQWVDDDGTRYCSDWGRAPYYRAVGSDVRIDRAERAGNVPYIHFRLYPIEDRRDFEGDACALVTVDLHLPKIDPIFYPTLEIIGFAPTMAATADVTYDDDDDGYRYTPANDPDWTPSLVRVTLRPAEDAT